MYFFEPVNCMQIQSELEVPSVEHPTTLARIISVTKFLQLDKIKIHRNEMHFGVEEVQRLCKLIALPWRSSS